MDIPFHCQLFQEQLGLAGAKLLLAGGLTLSKAQQKTPFFAEKVHLSLMKDKKNFAYKWTEELIKTY